KYPPHGVCDVSLNAHLEALTLPESLTIHSNTVRCSICPDSLSLDTFLLDTDENEAGDKDGAGQRNDHHAAESRCCSTVCKEMIFSFLRGIVVERSGGSRWNFLRLLMRC
uniref:Uncharacterized protein n=1 Tax=Acanthochromis polyacanthus TaxID=80966 RepID=A0A3Q1GSS0_9TELE